MTRSTETLARPQVRLKAISRQLRCLLDLRAALAPFAVTLQIIGDGIQEPEGRRQMLALWRPCQERFDGLVEIISPDVPLQARLRLLRHEIEDSLIDELCSPAALEDLVAAAGQACETLLSRIERDLRAVAAQLGATSPAGGAEADDE